MMVYIISRPNEFGLCLKNRYIAVYWHTSWGFVDTGPRRPEEGNYVMVYRTVRLLPNAEQSVNCKTRLEYYNKIKIQLGH